MPPSSGVPRPDRRSLDERIASSIIDAVVEGRFPPGQPLPAERDLAEDLGVNRTSLRQALARLEQIGLVATRQGSGNVVQDPATLTDPTVVRVLARHLDPGLVAEVLELRESFGAMIGRLAAQRSDAAQRDRIAAAVDAVAGAADPVARRDAELAFFSELIAATGNRPLALLLRWVEAAYGLHPDSFTAAFADGDEVVAGLRRISTAISRGRPGPAEAAVEDYLRESGRRMLAGVTGSAG